MDSRNTTHRRSCTEKLSESVFIGLCKILGTPQQFAMRRDVIEVMNMVQNYLEANTENYFWSGSYGEGFRILGSDVDIMVWPTDHRVFWDKSQIRCYNGNRLVSILADSSESPPGFTLLWFPVHRPNISVLSSSFRMKGRLYISSSKYIENIILLAPSCIKHGPCALNVMGKGSEYDHAHCFASDFWPPSASSWIGRCHSWPQPHVVQSVLRNGCHLVAIGHKLGNHENNEWRISFSVAEQTLVYSMKHCQLLTYGLLKLFLNEVINFQLSDERKLLCSYHMKTAIFWVLQENKISQWCQQNLLECFWVCFKLILKWVYQGVCPNFFIPENNMFLTKIHGDSQDTLFAKLHTLYERGCIPCLLQSPSIRSYIISALYTPRQSIFIEDSTLIYEAVFDIELFREIHRNGTPNTLNLISLIKALRKIEQLTRFLLTKYQGIMLQTLTAKILQDIAYLSYNLIPSSIHMYSDNNKVIYIFDKMSCHMLKMAAKFGCITDKLYLTMYYYRTCRYRKALYVIRRTKIKLALPHLVYRGVTFDFKRYMEYEGGRRWSTKLQDCVADHIQISNRIVYINELIIEQQSALPKRESPLFIPPHVLLFMMEFLIYYRQADTVNALTSLKNLQALVIYDQGKYIPPSSRDTSWHILGICQQITGDLHDALYSYQQSLKYQKNGIQTATVIRIIILIYELYFN